MRGVVTFVFDDGYERVYRTVLPLLAKYRLPGVFAIPLNAARVEHTEHRRVRPWSEWLHIKKQGHEIAAHSVTHRNLTSLTHEELTDELRTPAQQLGATTLVYPGGAFDDVVVAQAKKYYKSARTVIYGFEQLPPADPWRLKSYNFSRNNFSLLKANRLALWAYVTNSWLIETYHMIDANEQAMVHTVRPDQLEKHLQFVSRLPMHVKTIEQVMQDSL